MKEQMNVEQPLALDYFECGVCYELFNEGQRFPRVLMCGHTFCQRCISLIINSKDQFQCPYCKCNFGDLRLGQTYKNFALLKVMGLNKIQSKEVLSQTIIKETFSDIVDELDRCPKNLRKLVVKRTRDDENNPFQFDLIRSNKNSMRFYKLLVLFQNLEHFQFWVKFSAHGFEECLAQSLYQIKSLRKIIIVNQYDQYDRLKEVISLTSNEKVNFNIEIRKWTQ